MRATWNGMAMTLAGAIALISGAGALAEADGPVSPAPADAPKEVSGDASAPSAGVALDQLLTLPQDRTYSVEKKGGLTRGEWRARYGEVRAEVQKQRGALEQTERKMEDVGGGQWSVNPIPGSDSDSSRSPIDFQLRSELRRQRAELERLERKLRQLDIEADLAGAPDEWRS